MDPSPHLESILAEMRGPHPSGRRSARELGESLAHLVWESFSDALVDEELRALLARAGVPLDEGIPGDRVAEELLILEMWSHSRAVEVAFVDRAPEPMVREVLDHLHRAVFEDMVAHGTPAAQVPVFEQRVSARYASYRAAARRPGEPIGEAFLEHLRAGTAEPTLARQLEERTRSSAHPLRDFLAGVQLTEG